MCCWAYYRFICMNSKKITEDKISWVSLQDSVYLKKDFQNEILWNTKPTNVLSCILENLIMHLPANLSSWKFREKLSQHFFRKLTILFLGPHECRKKDIKTKRKYIKRKKESRKRTSRKEIYVKNFHASLKFSRKHSGFY